ncbi:MAG: sigma-54 dependent transcriptional regulator [Longimicrobiales bacterium]
MPDTVVITTQDLEPAVRLRDALRDEDYAIELLTPGERLSDVTDPCILIITGPPADKQSRRLLAEASEHGHLPVIGLITAEDGPLSTARARFGFTEAVLKPVDPNELAHLAKRLIARRHLQTVTGIIGETDAIAETLERVVQIAPVSSTVLLTGESGTGKERVARGIHALSSRRHRPFIATNVAAMAETLLESELFGHEKGAFTGAVGQRKGFFELAHKGTLFLDELGEMPLATQVKLLRALEEQRFRRLGGEIEIEVDVRVIAATNQPLRQLVEIGRFRRDLYFRLNVLHIELPPLRERRADIPILIDAFIRDASREHDRPPVTISMEALAILMEYDWPGNVRELKNLVESIVVLSHGPLIRPEDLPPDIRLAIGGRSRLLPVPIIHDDAGTTRAAVAPAPELEFIFRTLMQLRMDVEDLRRQFDDYSHDRPDLGTALPLGQPITQSFPAARDIHIPEFARIVDHDDDALDAEHEVVVFRPGMTLEQLEKNAILAALKEVAGNRRRAAEMLGMGERTLYRKIKEYGLPL